MSVCRDRHHLNDTSGRGGASSPAVEAWARETSPVSSPPMIDAVMWRVRTGSHWRDVCTSGPWMTVCNRHRLWWPTARGACCSPSRSAARRPDRAIGIMGRRDRLDRDPRPSHAAGAPDIAPSNVTTERLAVALEDFESCCSKHHQAPRHTGGPAETHEFSDRFRGRDQAEQSLIVEITTGIAARFGVTSNWFPFPPRTADARLQSLLVFGNFRLSSSRGMSARDLPFRTGGPSAVRKDLLFVELKASPGHSLIKIGWLDVAACEFKQVRLRFADHF